MPEADIPTTTPPPALSRRRLFATTGAVGAALAVPAAAVAPSHPDAAYRLLDARVVPAADAALIEACCAFQTAATSRNALFQLDQYQTEDVPDELLDPYTDQMDEVFEPMVDTPATTLAGVVARARALVAYEAEAAEPYEQGSGGWRDDISRAVIRDLLAVAGGVA